MPKLKTNRGAAKRFRVTKKGKFKFAKTGRRHLLKNETPKTGRKMRKAAYTHKAHDKQMKQLLPYA